MAQPIVMTVEHKLGKQEAKDRLQHGFSRARQSFPGFTETWSGDQMSFHVGAMGQTVTGLIEVFDETIRIEVTMPGVLGWAASAVAKQIGARAKLMIEKT